MLIELHLIQNFAPSNLNRDDTGAPKDCEFGGYRRARISSQCIKRSIRDVFKEQKLLPEENLAQRTRLVTGALIKEFTQAGKEAELSRQLAEFVLGGVKLKVEDGKTDYLLFLGNQEINALIQLCLEHWEALTTAMTAGAATPAETTSGKKVTKKAAKSAAQDSVPKEVLTGLEALLNGGKAADLALFGRMLADLPKKNIDAACQVAHAISVNKISMEFDYFTAIDDLQKDATGAGMLGTVEFNSACFYRYANLDTTQLLTNLGGDRELALKTIESFLKAAVLAIPTGKQNSMAAHNPPSLILIVVRQSGLWSLANAFLKPIYPTRETDLVQGAIQALSSYWSSLSSVYGTDTLTYKGVCSLATPELLKGGGLKVEASFKQLLDNALKTVKEEMP